MDLEALLSNGRPFLGWAVDWHNSRPTLEIDQADPPAHTLIDIGGCRRIPDRKRGPAIRPVKVSDLPGTVEDQGHVARRSTPCCIGADSAGALDFDGEDGTCAKLGADFGADMTFGQRV